MFCYNHCLCFVQWILSSIVITLSGIELVCDAFLWFVICVLSVMGCLLFFLVSLVDYDL